MIPPHIKAMYRPPFRLCPMGIFVFDARDEMVADDNGGDRSAARFRMRGWGWIQYLRGSMDEAAALHDEAETVLLKLVEGCEQNMAACVARLNKAWS
jgi:hypothetical protein